MKLLFFSVLIAVASSVYGEGLPSGIAQVETNPAARLALTYIDGDAAKALYKSMTDVAAFDSGDGSPAPSAGEDLKNSTTFVKKGQAIECYQYNQVHGTSYFCSLIIKSDGTTLTQ